MARTCSSVLFVVLLQFSRLWSASAVTCYGFGGQEYPDNLICPGSNACCGSTATCLSNRLCHNQGQNNDTFVRGPCALHPYDPASCADICLYNETTGFLPRVNVCADGSLCCDAFPNCCEAGQGVFLDNTGDIVASLSSTSSSTQAPSPSTTTPSQSSSSSPVTLSKSQTSSSSAASSTSSSASNAPSTSGLGTGAKVGIGIGVALGVIIAGLLALVLFQQRRLHQGRQVTTTDNLPSYGNDQKHSVPLMSPREIDSYHVPIVAELPVNRG